MARKLRILTVGFDRQQCHLMALQDTLNGVVRNGVVMRADIESLAERVKAVESTFLDMAAYHELTELVSSLEEEFAALVGEGGEVRGVRPGFDCAVVPYTGRRDPSAVGPHQVYWRHARLRQRV